MPLTSFTFPSGLEFKRDDLPGTGLEDCEITGPEALTAKLYARSHPIIKAIPCKMVPFITHHAVTKGQGEFVMQTMDAQVINEYLDQLLTAGADDGVFKQTDADIARAAFGIKPKSTVSGIKPGAPQTFAAHNVAWLDAHMDEMKAMDADALAELYKARTRDEMQGILYDVVQGGRFGFPNPKFATSAVYSAYNEDSENWPTEAPPARENPNRRLF
jgi:hypothetical protein